MTRSTKPQDDMLSVFAMQDAERPSSVARSTENEKTATVTSETKTLDHELTESLRSRIRELEVALEAEHDMHLSMGNEASEMYGLLQKAEATIVRLKSGDFTPEEFQNLCHSRNVNNLGMSDFCDGCDEYQRKLFGSCRSDLLHARYIGTRKLTLDRYLPEAVQLSMKLSSFCASTGLTDGHLVACTPFSEAVRRTMLEWAIENDATPSEMRAWYRLQHCEDVFADG